MSISGHFIRPRAAPDPTKRLLAAVVWRALRDAWRGDPDAAGWLDDDGVRELVRANLAADVSFWRTAARGRS
jgi:hypothetical protein